ncbi:MAG: RagB/SusD family nutrient uptake outer membrane protein [Bacteroidales bacterium]|nr:RagB/SusD family nutrient uptake outer membrane protein [Bacteroidales bacterium]
MKKIFIAIFVTLAAVALTSCSQDLLNIQQKGAVGQEEFYQNDDDALAAITAVYAQMNSYYYNYKFFSNLPSDNIYCGGGSRGDNDQWAQLNEFRTHPQTGSLGSYYRGAYNIIFKCNLLINNMEPNTAVTKRAIAEARFFRAWAHMVLTEFWGTPPLITEVLVGDEKPANTPKAELWKFIIDEFGACASDLPSKSNKNDKNAVCRITKECALAHQGKAQVLSGDYAGAKSTLKKVIDSGLYDLVPSSEYDNIQSKEGDLSPEVVMAIHVTENGTNTYTNDMLYLMWGWRTDHLTCVPNGFYNNSWGFMNPTKDFFDAFVAHDGPNSTRIRASVASWEQVLQMDFTGKPKFKTINPVHGNEGYFDMKFRYRDQNAVKARNGYSYINDRMYMRYAEVLLLYAEACAQSGDGDGSGLKALNAIQERAGAPITPLTLQNVKDEKRFELYLEGCRFVDLVRWGDAPKALAGHYEKIPEFTLDENGNASVTWNPYNTGKTHGYQAGKNEVYPFPYSELQVNENLVQNPGY